MAKVRDQSSWFSPGGVGRRDVVFVSYRESDSPQAVGRLTDDLREHYGRERVFRYTDSNRAGQDYVAQLDEALARSRAVLAVVGPTWLTTATADGVPRLHIADDPVRLELERAFASGALVVLVLAAGADTPRACLPMGCAAT